MMQRCCQNDAARPGCAARAAVKFQQTSDELGSRQAAVENSPLPAINLTRDAVLQYSGDA
jgi:hypothetical protein